jgi:hypothetical protein
MPTKVDGISVNNDELISLAAQVMGRKGGKTTVKRYGSDHFKRCNEISLQVRRRKRDEKKEKTRIRMAKVVSGRIKYWEKERKKIATKKKRKADKIEYKKNGLRKELEEKWRNQMIYDFVCRVCKKRKAVDKSVEEYKKMEPMVCCDQPMDRDYTGVRIDSHGDGTVGFKM